MRAICYVDGQWHEGNPLTAGPMTHAMWMASTVFDGARVFEGVAPDLDLHCDRLIRSAASMGLEPPVDAREVERVCREGIARFDREAELYVRPAMYAADGFVIPDAASTTFTVAVFEAALPRTFTGSACFSTYRRPSPETAPTFAKASCLYPLSGMAQREAAKRGFSQAIMLDLLGNVAEFASSNLWIAKDGVARTPTPNGTFLDGITRQRVISLLREDGIPVEEMRITPADVMDADELFSTGNYGKVLPFVRVEDRDLQPGPIATRARELYWQYAHASG